MISAIARKWKAFFALALLSVVALPFESAAQGPAVSGPAYSKGNFLRKPDYATQNALTLFVDAATGNDNSTCSTSASPCLTFQGAVDKIPKLVRHPVTIDSADGTYPNGFVVNAFRFDPVNVTNGAYIWFRGAYKAFVPATGTATGTVTAFSAGSNAGFVLPIVTDSTQAWTVNNLRGQIIEITGGTGSGQFRVIESNTATTITTVGFFSPSLVPASSTYAIRDWGTVVTGVVAQPSLPNVSGGPLTGVLIAGNAMNRTSTSSSPIYFDKIRIAPGTAASVAMQMYGSAAQMVYLNQVSVVGTSAGAISLANSQGGSIRVNTSYIYSLGGNAINLGASTGTTSQAAHSLTLSMMQSDGASGSAVTGGWNGLTVTQSEFRTTSATGLAPMFILNNAQSSQCSFCKFECAAGSSSTGLLYAGSFAGGAAVVFGLSNSSFNNCTTGISLAAGGRIFSNASGLAFSNLTNGVVLTKGAILEFGNPDTFTTVTNQITLDGVIYTYAALTALTPKVIFNLNYGTWVGAP